MIIYFVGAVNGQLKKLYNWPLFQEANIPKPDWIICVGSLGCFPDPQRVDRGTRKKGVGDFPELYLKQTPVPIPTLFVEGPHEDHRWLEERAKQGHLDVLPLCTLLKNGNKATIGSIEHTLDVVGVGRPFSSRTFKEPWNDRGLRYYTRAHIEKACAAGPTDILVTHEGVYGEQYGSKKCEAQGVKKIIYATRPKLLVHGHYNHSREYRVLGVPAYSLANGEILIMRYDGNKFKRL
jgi:hypothetical protein